MPKDEWSKATRRDFGNQAAYSGECFRKGDWANEPMPWPKKKGRRRRKKRRK